MKKKIVSILILIQLVLLILINSSFAVNNGVTVATENNPGQLGTLPLVTTTNLTYTAANYYEEMGYYGTRKLVDPSYLTLCRKFKL